MAMALTLVTSFALEAVSAAKFVDVWVRPEMLISPPRQLVPAVLTSSRALKQFVVTEVQVFASSLETEMMTTRRDLSFPVSRWSPTRAANDRTPPKELSRQVG